MQNSRYAFAGFAAIVVAGGLVAYCSQTGQKTEQAAQPSVQKTELAAAPDKSAATTPEQKTDTPAATATAPAQTGAGQPVEPLNSAQQTTVTVPVFDVLRLEGDGSLVIAGKASPGSAVDVISKTRVLGSAKAGDNGDFAIILDQALKAGDYQLVLRATSEGSSVATSQQTAILSVPEKPDGQVLALVEEPGQASRMITMPQAGVAGTVPEEHKTPETNDNNGAVTAVLPPETVQGGSSSSSAVSTVSIAVEAVEIEGRKVFVAGHARGGQSVNVYANDTQLGAAIITPEGRYLVQSQQPLAVGDYIIRAELLSASGKVLATARVPFRRDEGDNIAAVAPAVTANPATQEQGSEQAANGEAGETAQALEKAEGSVIIRKGDNLWTISKRTYGSGLRYTTIYLANRDQIKNPDLIWPGQIFVMPKQPLNDQESEPKQP